ncbi:MAG: hypothetical protein IKE55_03230 [Kiritimatiellae bacterium]|nr:hypothetical protein [Kiritimatiellia bacterium]
MPVKVRIEHVGDGYMEIWKSPEMQAEVDRAGERIAGEACDGYTGEWFRYYPKQGSKTAMGFVSSTGLSGAYYQQRDKALSKAVHP